MHSPTKPNTESVMQHLKSLNSQPWHHVPMCHIARQRFPDFRFHGSESQILILHDIRSRPTITISCAATNLRSWQIARIALTCLKLGFLLGMYFDFDWCPICFPSHPSWFHHFLLQGKPGEQTLMPDWTGWQMDTRPLWVISPPSDRRPTNVHARWLTTYRRYWLGT